jgi:hypothetical protein
MPTSYNRTGYFCSRKRDRRHVGSKTEASAAFRVLCVTALVPRFIKRTMKQREKKMEWNNIQFMLVKSPVTVQMTVSRPPVVSKECHKTKTWRGSTDVIVISWSPCFNTWLHRLSATRSASQGHNIALLCETHYLFCKCFLTGYKARGRLYYSSKTEKKFGRIAEEYNNNNQWHYSLDGRKPPLIPFHSLS